MYFCHTFLATSVRHGKIAGHCDKGPLQLIGQVCFTPRQA